MSGPDFLVVGAQRAGTSWLYGVLLATPGIWVPPIKELHYWSSIDPVLGERNRRWRDHLEIRAKSNAASLPLLRRLAPGSGRPDRRFDRRYFAGRRSDDWYGRLFDRPGQVSGELCPAYSALSTPTIRRVRQLAPTARIVLTFRDPVDRLWSAGVKTLARDQGRRVDGVSLEEWRAFLRRPEVLRRSQYHAALRRWAEAFPPGQIHLDSFESLTTDPAGFLDRLLASLGVVADVPRLLVGHRDAVNPAGAGWVPPDEVLTEIARVVRPDLEALHRAEGLVDLAEPLAALPVTAWLERARGLTAGSIR